MPKENEKESTPSLMRPDSTLVTLALASVLALGISLTAAYLPSWQQGAQQPVASSPTADGVKLAQATTPAANAASAWAASAPGRVKPNGGEIGVKPEAQGVIKAVHVKVGDEVYDGDPIATLGSEDALARLAAARAEVQVRIAEREEEPETNNVLLDWRKLLDGFAAAERKLHQARVSFDKSYLDYKATGGNAEKVASARKVVMDAIAEVSSTRQALVEFETNTELPASTRLDSGLAIARSDLRLAEIAVHKTKVRATANGTILSLDAKVGEFSGPAVPTPTAIFGDLRSLEVTAEVEERDIGQVALGQQVVVRSNAFEGQDFTGKVIRIAPRVATPGLGLRGPSKPRDVEVLEVDIALDGSPAVLSGMRVDVFFKPKGETKAAAAAVRK